jgi:ribosome-associated protein
MVMKPFSIDLSPELIYSASRSSGAGGQNVNKVNTKIELRFNIQQSVLLTDEQKNILLQKLAPRITEEGDLIVISQVNRSQLKNKEEATERFYQLLTKALIPRRKRIATHPSRASKENRLSEKKRKAEIKNWRKRFDHD